MTLRDNKKEQCYFSDKYVAPVQTAEPCSIARFRQGLKLITSNKSNEKEGKEGPKTYNGVLITDGENRIALSVLRSLARRNIDTAIAVEDSQALSSFSRYCKNRILCPPASKNPEGFLATIHRLIKINDFDSVFPVTDYSLIHLSERRDLLNPYVKLPLPIHESVKKTFDKSLTVKMAEKDGIPTPKTFFVHNIAELKDAARKVPYPAVIKPKSSWVWHQGKALHNRPFYVDSASELLASYMAVHNDFPFPIIQEHVPGQNISIAAIADNGEPKAACCIKVHRAMPVTGGNSVLRETIQLDPEVTKYAFLLLKDLRWHGVAEVEFRIDTRDSTPKLMEINGRFWASLQVAIDSGIDFPYILYRLIMNEKVQPVFSYKIGVKGRWLLGDVQHLLSVLKGEPKIRAYRPSRLRTLLNFARFYEKDLHYDNFFLDDPIPLFMRY